ncbi:MAG TPA: NAD(P)H-hydrate epimerase, partial [Spirochaetia bacterium]|nr:NAD(P)H-hydrate epimerase [Spirochaetia bacterium]
MENAGRNLAECARNRFMKGNARGNRVVVLAGTGNNGGGSLVCGRHLYNWGSEVTVVITKSRPSFKTVAAHQLDILERMGVSIKLPDALNSLDNFDLIVDGIIGYGLSDTPKGSAARLIRWANIQKVPILSLDVPSGVDATTGTVFSPSLRATATMTLALPKEGFLDPRAIGHIGELYLADISVPLGLYRQMGLDESRDSLFAEKTVIRIF